MTHDALNFPKLRWPIDIRQETINQQEIIVLRCPLGISEQALGLFAAVAPLLGRFSGQESCQQIAAHFSVAPQIVNDLVQLLDQNLFLESPRFFEFEREISTRFKNSRIRRAALAGLSYPDSTAELRTEIERILGHATPEKLASIDHRQLLCLKSPHIDYQRGQIGYAKAYVNLVPNAHDLFVLIGTSHQYSRLIFHLTTKSFESPLGTLECDEQAVSELAGSYGLERSFADEILHRREHSLELQVPFMALRSAQAKIIPILVGSFHHMLNSGKYPEHFEEYDCFVAALTQVLRSRQARRICVIAGVDMAHVGRYFGDKSSLTSAALDQIRARDMNYLEAIRAGAKHKLFDHIAEDEDARRICGFPTMYCVLDLIERLGWKYQVELFEYRQAVDYTSDCAVTFAGMGFYSTANSLII